MVDLRKLRAVSVHFRAYPVSRVGVIGSLVAAIGALCPLVDIAGHHITYFARGHGDGQIVVGAAFIGLIAAVIRVRVITALMGVVILTMLYNLYSHELAVIARIHDAADHAGIFSGLAGRLADSVSVEWGLYVMAFGAVLMVLSPIFRPRRS
jgi:hypothetical protein